MLRERKLRIIALFGFAGLIVAVLILVVPLIINSYDFLLKYGKELISSMNWNPPQNVYGGLQFILGTLWVTFWSTLIAMPLSISLALLATELSPKRLKTLIAGLTDLIAAIPSVVYGYWGLVVFAPLLATTVYPYLLNLSKLPIIGILFSTSVISPQCVLTAVLVLSLMITPYATAIIRNGYEMVPKDLVEAVYALGGTKWDVIKMNLSYIKSTIIAGVIIAAGRAMGETMAVTMLIGNNVGPFKPCLLCRGSTITSVVANEFEEALLNPYHAKALTALILILIIMGSLLLAFGRRLGKKLVEAEIIA